MITKYITTAGTLGLFSPKQFEHVIRYCSTKLVSNTLNKTAYLLLSECDILRIST